MKTLYLVVSAILVISILLFIASFIYLDKEKHQVYYYAVNIGGRDVGAVRIDKFVTEDKFIYKSIASEPFEPIFKETKSRLTLDRRHRLESYSRERTAAGTAETVSLENAETCVGFAATFGPKFAILERIPIKNETFVFEETSPVTYMPLIENYDFKKGRSQGFYGLTCFSKPSLPPMKRFVTLTSIKDEFLKIDRRRIKTENLILKIKNYPKGSVWVAKSDKSLIMVEIPEIGLKITRKFWPKAVDAKEYDPISDEYEKQSVLFKNKSLQMSGTLTVPKGRTLAAWPAVLLVWGDGPCDRRYQGFFASISDYLARSGFCVLSFDKRGTGLSDGNATAYTDSDLADDVGAALEYLAAQSQIDPARIGILSHSEGALYAMKACLKKDTVKWLVIMAPTFYASLGDEISKRRNEAASKARWSDEYLKMATMSAQETTDKVKGSAHNWAYAFGRRLFLKNTREAIGERPFDIVKKIEIPVLILQGKEGDDSVKDTASRIDEALGEAENPDHTITYYSYLGHFFGNAVTDGIHENHYEVDREVLGNIKNWLVNRDTAAPQSK